MSQSNKALLPTPGQLAILQRVANGETQRAIALDLGIGYQTVKNTMIICRRRMGAISTFNAVAIAIRGGLIK